ncbi:MAG: nucleotidyltransferase family protein [Proteobacteria bacterium]|nr:nucleotidyltransferase family protein [Pseudomonadota bacterium]
MTPPQRAMVLAAGLGLRMRPLTERLPKPLLPVAGKAMLDRVLDHLAQSGVRECVVNTHHEGEMIAAHLADRESPEVRLAPEPELLETGGSVFRALDELGPGPFFVVNGDVIWRDGEAPAPKRLAGAWDEKKMDALLLLQGTADAIGYDGAGDFFIDPEGEHLGTLHRRQQGAGAPFVFTGIQLLHPRLFDPAPDGRFSLNLLYDAALARGRLFGLVHDGEWYHIGTPEGLELAESHLGAGPEEAKKAADDAP